MPAAWTVRSWARRLIRQVRYARAAANAPDVQREDLSSFLDSELAALAKEQHPGTVAVAGVLCGSGGPERIAFHALKGGARRQVEAPKMATIAGYRSANLNSVVAILTSVAFRSAKTPGNSGETASENSEHILKKMRISAAESGLTGSCLSVLSANKTPQAVLRVSDVRT